ncbi:hypothetical protein ACIG5E_16525 [Kitasatospora sp. NPDC053057]|uniref:hypothetical protein n=1 Tax=Kitasatospora sp. NPDC053057 TaxID=3364062 RepID=UPI0037CC1720
MAGRPNNTTNAAPTSIIGAAAHHGPGNGIPLPNAADTNSSIPAADPRGPVALSAPDTNAVSVSPTPSTAAPTCACCNAVPTSIPNAEATTADPIRPARNSAGSTRSFIVACIAPSPANTPRSSRCADNPAASGTTIPTAARTINTTGTGGRAGRTARAHQGV